MKKASFLFTFLVLLFFISCNNEEKDTSIYEAPDESVIASVNSHVINPNGSNPNVQLAGQSGTWGAFEAMFKACVENSDFPDKKLFSKYKLLYLGPSNAKYLGTIFSKNGVVDKTELATWLKGITRDSFTTKGFPVTNCNLNIIKDNALDLFLDWNKIDKADTALQNAIGRKDNITINSLVWSIDEFRTAELKKYLSEHIQNNDIKFYLEQFSDPKNITIFKVVKIKGFSCDIHTDHAFSVGLGAQLNINNPLKINVQSPTSSTDSIGFGLKFSTQKEKTIHIESEGEFFAFGLAMKGKQF